MRQYKERTVKRALPDRVLCNCCGKPIDTGCDDVPGEFLSIVKRWGYFSPFDGEKHTIDLCLSCYQQWIRTFVIPPAGEE